MTTDVVGARRPARITPAVPRAGGAAMLFSVCLLGYGLLGYLLTAQFNLIDGDGPSRVANAGYTILSRNPHLGAMGFVWNPLPSLVELPLLGFSHWWPELKTLGLAAVIQSALFMAGAAVGVRRIAFDRDVPRLGRWAAVAAFAANPMIVQYGAVGLSEAALIFCVVWSVRYLLLWVQSGAATSLAWSGLALGFGYLARYEALPAVAGGAAFVLLLAAYRACDPSRLGRVSTWRKALPSGSRPRSCSAFPRWAPSCCGRSRPGCSPGMLCRSSPPSTATAPRWPPRKARVPAYSKGRRRSTRSPRECSGWSRCCP
ncbi:hypothetical protein GS545_25275 [Rhodococcus hoagii]|nr:hypothetical protein [Prescottella equi]